MLKRNTVISRGTSRFKGVSFVARPDGNHKWEARLGLKDEAEVGAAAGVAYIKVVAQELGCGGGTVNGWGAGGPAQHGYDAWRSAGLVGC